MQNQMWKYYHSNHLLLLGCDSMAKGKGLVNLFFKTGDEAVDVGAKNLDEIGQIMGVGLRESDNALRVPRGWRIQEPNGALVKGGGGVIKNVDEIPPGSKIVNIATKRNNTTVRAMDKGIPLPGFKTTAKLGFAVGVGGIVWNILSFTESVSTNAADTINNFFGANCPPDDEECIANGARNLAIVGFSVIGIGVLALMSYFKPAKKTESSQPVEIKVTTEEKTQAVGA